jgi:hypothetical protein
LKHIPKWDPRLKLEKKKTVKDPNNQSRADSRPTEVAKEKVNGPLKTSFIKLE